MALKSQNILKLEITSGSYCRQHSIQYNICLDKDGIPRIHGKEELEELLH